jgi:hypothetical protein
MRYGKGAILTNGFKNYINRGFSIIYEEINLYF